MSEELNEVDNKEVKKKTEPEITENDNSQEIKKKNTSKKVDIIEKYQYIPEANEQLIVDRPTESLKKIDEMKLNNEKNIKNEQHIVKSNKELYESYIKELKFFSLSINNDIIYDSSIDKSKESPIKFDNDYFILYGKKYSYNGLKIQKINKK
jgi:homoserine dehydrogenase